MKQKFNAGAMLDVITPDEMRGIMREYMVDVAKGIWPIRFVAQGVAAADGTVTVGGATTLTGGNLGPAASFRWAVTRLSVRINNAPAGAFSIYINSTQPQDLVRDVATTSNGYVGFGTSDLMLSGDDSLVITASGATAGQIVVITGQAIEIPNQLLWKYMGS